MEVLQEKLDDVCLYIQMFVNCIRLNKILLKPQNVKMCIN